MTQFAIAEQSARNLVLGRLNGANVTVIRDITDIAHPTNVNSIQLASPTLVPWGPWKPMFIGGTEVGDGTDQNLTRISISTGQTSIILAGCPNALVTFGWNRLGDHMTYLREVATANGWQFEWHLVGQGGDQLLAVTPAWCHCDGEGPADNYSIVVGFSPDGSNVFLVEGLPIRGPVPIQIRKLSGGLVASLPGGGSMPAWSGSDLYFRDAGGVERWRAGSVSSVLGGVPWIRPSSSPAGDKIVYWVRGSDGLGRVYLLDLTTETSRLLSSHPRMEPVFLSSRYIWYQGERSCTPTDQCVFNHTLPTGVSYIYDLTDGTEGQSSIAAVYDVWPRGG